MQEKPFFSVVIPTFNRRPIVRLAIESVLSQTFSNFQLIVVDDGSQDGSGEMIKREFKNRLIYIYQKNQGPAAARNTGLREARGRFICFLDSDDRFRKEKLELAYTYIKKYPQYKIFHTEEIWYRRGKFLEHKKKHRKPQGDVFRNALKLCCISISTAVIKRDVFGRIGEFDAAFPVCEDYEFWLRAAAVYKVKLIPKVLTIKEGGRKDELSQQKGLDKYRALAIKKLIDNFPLTPQQKKYAQEELKRKVAIYAQGAQKRGKNQEAEELLKLAG